MSDIPYGTCPYNKNHRIRLFRMPGHIVKCEKNYRGPPLVICKYNATHRVLPEELGEHLESCIDGQQFNDNKYFEIATRSWNDAHRLQYDISEDGYCSDNCNAVQFN